MIRAALLALLLAQNGPDIRSNVVNVQVPVTVMDKKGNFITGLDEDDFRLLDGGSPQRIKVDESVHPISLVVAVQANSNTRDVLTTVLNASALLMPLIAGQSGEIAVLTFNDRLEVLTPFTSDADELRTAFAKLKPGGGPHHLDDAAMEAVRMVRSRGVNRKKIILLIGEGYDQGSAVAPADIFQQAEREDILIYGVRMKRMKEDPTPARNATRPENRAPLPMGEMPTLTSDARVATVDGSIFRGLFASNNLSAYSQFTGARAQDFSNLKSLETAIQNIGKEVHSQYLLTFAPQNRDPGYHELTVHLPKPNLQVRARRGYWLAAQSEVR